MRSSQTLGVLAVLSSIRPILSRSNAGGEHHLTICWAISSAEPEWLMDGIEERG